MRLTPAFAAAAIACLPALAAACAGPVAPDGWKDARVSVGPDCSYSGAGSEYGFDILAGKAVDIGGGRIGQRVTEEGACSSNQYLLVVDCNDGGMIGIGGVPYGNELSGGLSVKLLQAPHGAIRLTATTTVADLVAVARANGYSYWQDVPERIAKMKRRNRPDPACGCRLFYPDSESGKE
jgi:hypothetical protein